MTARPDRSPDSSSPREIRRDDALYPPLLHQIDDPPETLYVQGDVSLLAQTSAAVMGARRATALGLEMGERLGAGLAAAGVVVVSGCAIGIDAAAHQGALQFGGATIAVLAGGLDVAVPPSNRSLARRIVDEGGCLVGEFPNGVPVARYAFPRRNRIIAGLSRVVVVVEAARRSGALITARLALAAGREVLVVPGHPLQEAYAGSNGLLADGASPVLSAQDVLAQFAGLPGLEAVPNRDPHAARARVLAELGSEGRAPEALAAALDMPLGIVLATLTELELLGLARTHPGQRYALPRAAESKPKSRWPGRDQEA